MELQSRGTPLPPFFAAVRRRHPDVDIVLLPDETAPEAPLLEPVSGRILADALDLVTGIVTRAWASVVGDGQLPESRFVFGPDPASVVARARASTVLDTSPLVPLAAALSEGGWALGHESGAVSLLFGRRGPSQLVASYAPETGTFILTVTSDPLPVGAERARELARR
jgi:hypothetical protein